MSSSSAKRQSLLAKAPSGPKAPVSFASNIIIAESAILTGSHTVIVGGESTIHPRAKLESTNGRITIGRRCVIHERCHIGAPPPEALSNEFGVMVEDYVAVEVGAIIESGCTTIGEGCLIGVGSKIGKGAKLGKVRSQSLRTTMGLATDIMKHCTITAKSVIKPGEKLPDYTVVYSNGLRRMDKRGIEELKNKAQARHIEVLKRLIPSKPAKFTSDT